jgi:acyl carrier protein
MHNGQAPDANALRGFLQTHLPAYMVPSPFVFLAEMPLTPSGKIDRRALPEIDRSRRDSQETFVAPRTVVEQKLAEILANLLHLDQVGVHDNFFELGGHSLLAAKVIARVRDTFQIELSLRNLFDSPTVGKLAEFVREARNEGAETIPAIRALPRQRRSVKTS